MFKKQHVAHVGGILGKIEAEARYDEKRAKQIRHKL
jgi:hypothetical protein